MIDWEFILRITPGIAAVVGLGWWLSGQFARVKNDLHNMLNTHEEKDQIRHEANLLRFEKISVDLARMGLLNGIYGSQKEN